MFAVSGTCAIPRKVQRCRKTQCPHIWRQVAKSKFLPDYPFNVERNNGTIRTIKQPWNHQIKSKNGTVVVVKLVGSNLLHLMIRGVFCLRILSWIYLLSLTFSPSDRPSPLPRQPSGGSAPERAIRIRIINIISFHCDPRHGPLHTQGQDAANNTAGISSRLSIYARTHVQAPLPHTRSTSLVAKLQFERRQWRRQR